MGWLGPDLGSVEPEVEQNLIGLDRHGFGQDPICGSIGPYMDPNWIRVDQLWFRSGLDWIDKGSAGPVMDSVGSDVDTFWIGLGRSCSDRGCCNMVACAVRCRDVMCCAALCCKGSTRLSQNGARNLK